jgi:hypothetical protein
VHKSTHRDGGIDGLANIVGDKRECGSGISNCRIAGTRYAFSIDACSGGIELPEALSRSDQRGVVRLRNARMLENVLVNVSKGIETLAFVVLIAIAPGSQIGSE